MSKCKYDIGFYKTRIRELDDNQLIMRIDEFQKLHDSEDVFQLFFWNDANKILSMMYVECYMRFKGLVDSM